MRKNRIVLKIMVSQKAVIPMKTGERDARRGSEREG